MDRETHARFLEYLEMFQYFREPGQKRLDVTAFLALDAELDTLLQAEQAGSADPEARRRIRALRRALLRD